MLAPKPLVDIIDLQQAFSQKKAGTASHFSAAIHALRLWH
jgi:hypothetical protein